MKQIEMFDEFPFVCDAPAPCKCLSHNGFLTRTGYRVVAEAEQRYLDRVGSVSASTEVELHWPPDALIEEQYRRFHNGFSSEGSQL